MSANEIPAPISSLIEKKSGAIVSHAILWERAARKALSASESVSSATKLIQAMRSPRNLDSLASGLAGEGKTVDGFLSVLLSQVDESIFDMDSWIGAFEVVQGWLLEQNRLASPHSILGFVNCSSEFASSVGNRESLPGLVESMLSEYGFEGDDESCSNMGE